MMNYDEANVVLIQVKTLLEYDAIDKLDRQSMLALSEKLEQARCFFCEQRLSLQERGRQIGRYKKMLEEYGESPYEVAQ